MNVHYDPRYTNEKPSQTAVRKQRLRPHLRPVTGALTLGKTANDQVALTIFDIINDTSLWT